MVRKNLFFIVFAVLLSLATFSARAENRYQIEVIVFEHLYLDEGNEIWPERDERPQWSDALQIFSGVDDSRFTPLSSARYRMGGIYRALRSSQGYQPIMHIAWQQVGLPASRARPVYVASDNGQVEGAIRLRQSRFLHIDMDLVYPLGDGAGKYARIDQSRRLKLNELHYFDNPLFGAIVQVTRADGG